MSKIVMIFDQSKYIKEVFSLWMDNMQASKAIEFLAFQMTQNKHNGPCHATFLFLPTKELLHPKRVSFIERGKTQETLKKERSNIHTSLVFSQWMRGGGQLTSHTYSTESIYLPKSNLSFANNPRLELFPMKPPTQRSLIWAAHKSSK